MFQTSIFGFKMLISQGALPSWMRKLYSSTFYSRLNQKVQLKAKPHVPRICLSPKNSCNLSKKDTIFGTFQANWGGFQPIFWGVNLSGIKIPLITCPSCIYPSENTMETQPFEDVFPIESGGFSNVMLVFRGVSQFVFQSTPDRFQHTEI